MQAVVIHETGGPEVLQLEEVDAPEPGDGEVLIRVSATTVNPIDWKRRRELADDFPLILGYDVSGVVESSRADGFAEDDEVFGSASSGAYAEYAVAPAAALALKPDGVSHEQAATIPVSGETAWQGLLRYGGMASGQTALIAGAAGGVGHFGVQFGRHSGAHVIGTGSGRNRDFVLGIGADEYVDYTKQEVADAVSDVDIVFDTVGGGTTGSLVGALRKGGVLVTIAGDPPEEAAAERGARALVFSSTTEGDELAEIAELVASGEVRPELSEVLPLTEVQRAHELSESGHTRGKIVLTIAS
jgi:NADPH:quinone reductase-like Zn-dependent oxidoreductase